MTVDPKLFPALPGSAYGPEQLQHTWRHSSSKANGAKSRAPWLSGIGSISPPRTGSAGCTRPWIRIARMMQLGQGFATALARREPG